MKIKSGFMLREIAGQCIVVPLGSRVVEFNNVMTLSESGAILWRLLESGAEEDELVNALLSEYEVDADTAKNDISHFMKTIKEKQLCE